MGGPCFILREGADSDDKIRGPDCTDNFQLRPFEYQGRTWQSVEQAYQALKWSDAASLDAWEQELPSEGESAFNYGNRMWKLARTTIGGEKVPDFDAKKLEIMWLLNCAKYQQHMDLQEQLLETGNARIYGGKSTWLWSKYNGLIQRLIRHRLRAGEALTNTDGLLEALEGMAFKDEGSRAWRPEISESEQAQLDGLPEAKMGFMDLKRHVISLGHTKAEIDDCPSKHHLLQLIRPMHAPGSIKCRSCE